MKVETVERPKSAKEHNVNSGIGYSIFANTGLDEATTEPRQKHSSRAVDRSIGFILAPKMIYCKFRHIPVAKTYKKNNG